MTPSTRVVLAFLAAGLVVTAEWPQPVQAHFKLLEPASWLVEGERGDPQKAAPCGSAPNDATAKPTDVVGKAVGGSKLHLKMQETVYHPGHYRVALAVNSRDELPPDPVTTERMTGRGAISVWAVIQSPPQMPVIADGLFQHYTRPAPRTPPQPMIWETDVQLPNITCAKCTLQVIQFMAEHAYNNPGGYSYHHCADVAIAADPAKPITTGWPAPK